MKTYFENEGDECQKFIGENPIYSLLRHAIGVTVCTEEDYKPSPVPYSVSRYQMDTALLELKITATGYVKTSDEVLRDNSQTTQSLSKLGADEIDDLFRLAATK